MFEGELIRTTEAYYKVESKRCMNQFCELGDVGGYLRHTDQRLREEEERVHFYLSFLSLDALQACVDRCFISDFVEQILKSGKIASLCSPLEQVTTCCCIRTRRMSCV